IPGSVKYEFGVGRFESTMDGTPFRAFFTLGAYYRKEHVLLIGGATIDDKTTGARRLIIAAATTTGTGDFTLLGQNSNALAIASRRIPLGSKEPTVLDHVDRSRMTVLPNTAGCFDAETAVRTARLARELLGDDLVKLEVLYDQASLLPEPLETLKALDVLVKE